MGARIFTSAVHQHRSRSSAVPFSNEPRIVIHWDGVANNKQHDDLADGVVWVNTAELMRPGVNMGLNIQGQNTGATEIAIAGSLSPGGLMQILEKNDAYGSVMITAENSNFKAEGTVGTSEVTVLTSLYSLLKITFVVGEPASLQLTAY